MTYKEKMKEKFPDYIPKSHPEKNAPKMGFIRRFLCAILGIHSWNETHKNYFRHCRCCEKEQYFYLAPHGRNTGWIDMESLWIDMESFLDEYPDKEASDGN